MRDKLTINKDSNIIWFVVILYLLDMFAIKPEVFLIIEMIVIFFLLLGSRRIIIPRVNGLAPYLGYIIFVSIMGLVKYGVQLAQRDLFYQLSSILTIILGYLFYMMNEDKKKSLWSSVCFTLMLSSIVCLVRGILALTGTMEFVTFRSTFEIGIKSISLLLPILAGKMLFLKEKTLPWKLDIVTIILWMIQIVLNLSRTALVNLAISTVVVLVVVILKKRASIASIIKLVSFLVVTILIVVALTSLMPKEAKKTFSKKIDNMFEEVSSDGYYGNSETAQEDWRGYENSEALEQWKKSDAITKIIGSGNGKLIHIRFVPYQWKSIIEKQNNVTGVTILHNTFYTLLIKGGIILVALLLIFLFRNALLAIKMIRNDDYLFEGIVLLCIVMYILMDGYVVRVMIDRGEEMAPMLLLGYINALYYRRKDEDEEVEKNEEV